LSFPQMFDLSSFAFLPHLHDVFFKQVEPMWVSWSNECLRPPIESQLSESIVVSVSFNRKVSRTRFRRPRCLPIRSRHGFIFPKAGRTAFRRAGVTDVSSHNLRKTFATRLLSRGAAITDVQHLLGHASVKTTEKAYAAFVKNERFKQTIDLLDKPVMPRLKVVR